MAIVTSYPGFVSPSGGSTGEQRMTFPGVTWKQYLQLNDAVDTPGVRMAYCDGVLEIMRTSREHEAIKKFIARLVETWALELGIPLYSYGSTTFRAELRERGAEPDECWVVGEQLREFPEIVLEVVLTHGGINKLDVYRSMNVPEVWFWLESRFELYRLGDTGYQATERSVSLPALDFQEIARLVRLGDQHVVVTALRDRLRQH